MKNKTIAAILAIFLGGLGIHKFYLGRYLLGILYLLLSWTGIPSIIAFFEGLHYFFMSDLAFDIEYNKIVILSDAFGEYRQEKYRP
jgi:TM2 domain-containing membrane protein YozV